MYKFDYNINDNLTLKVSKIIDNVKNYGDKALSFYTELFDGIKIKTGDFIIPYTQIKDSKDLLNPNLKISLKKAAQRISYFHKQELKRYVKTWKVKYNGCIVGQVLSAVENVGIYIPGGRFSYPSTVLMTVIPAKIAGARRIVIVTPPKQLTPSVLYAAYICGCNEIYRIGGAQAIAALTFGTESIPKVDLIIGPGNLYVNEAKRQVIGMVGIDSLAGPSEVAIVADETTPIEYITEDLMAQVEHDPTAKAYLFSDSNSLINKIKKSIPNNILEQITFYSGGYKDIIETLNKISCEHVQIMTKNALQIYKKIKNAGAIFIGKNTPCALGDYWAGPSHVLPTGGTARFSSGLSVATFLKRTSYIQNKNLKPSDLSLISNIAKDENLIHHAISIEKRI